MSELLATITALKQGSKALKIAALSSHASTADRVFGRGQDSKDADILDGKYSSDPIYVGKSSPVKVAPKGKTGKTKFKSGKPHTSRYFAGGYKEFRGHVGRSTSTVNLRLSGQLERDWKIEPAGLTWVSGFSNPTNDSKADGNEARNKAPIFDPSPSDLKVFKKVFEFELQKLIP